MTVSLDKNCPVEIMYRDFASYWDHTSILNYDTAHVTLCHYKLSW